MISQEMITSDAQKEFATTDYESEKILLANQAMQIGVEWMQIQLKFEAPNMTKHEKRRARRAQRNALATHIRESLQQSDNLHAVGFLIPAFILLVIIETVISWVVWQLLNKYFS
jgi:hypothetical protein